MKIKTKSDIKHDFKSSKSLTALLLAIAGFLLFWFLLSGSMTDNRFGAHLVWASDLTSTPLWYGLTIMWISIALMLGSVIMFSLLYREKLHLSEGQEKSIRIGSLFIIGFSIFYAALSSITFAAFNTQFFESTLSGDFKFTSMMGGGESFLKTIFVSDQAIAIGSLSLITIVIIIAIVLFFFVSNKDMNKKAYYSLRNGALALIALSWVVVVLNIMAFGAMGGDAGVLLTGLTGVSERTVDQLASILGMADSASVALDGIVAWGEMSAKDSYIVFANIMNEQGISPNELLGNDIGFFLGGDSWKDWSVDLNGTWGLAWGTVISPMINANADLLTGLSNVLKENSNEISIISGLLGNLYKDSLFLGVNNSFNSYLIFTILLVLTISIIPYMIVSYNLYDDNSLSMTYDWSVYSIIGGIMVYGLFAWILAYIPFGDMPNSESEYIFNALVNNEFPSLNPGLIGGGGTIGGINQAIVYYFPYYNGTISWWIGFSMILIIPFATLILSLFLHRENMKNNLAKKAYTVES